MVDGWQDKIVIEYKLLISFFNDSHRLLFSMRDVVGSTLLSEAVETTNSTGLFVISESGVDKVAEVNDDDADVIDDDCGSGGDSTSDFSVTGPFFGHLVLTAFPAG